MVEANKSQKFKLKTIEETKNYFVEETNPNELMNKKHKMVVRLQTLLILATINTCCISISAFLF